MCSTKSTMLLGTREGKLLVRKEDFEDVPFGSQVNRNFLYSRTKHYGLIWSLKSWDPYVIALRESVMLHGCDHSSWESWFFGYKFIKNLNFLI